MTKLMNSPMHRKSSKAAIRAIKREYELKRNELNLSSAPQLKRGPLFYAIIILILIPLGAAVIASLGKGVPIWGKAQVDAKLLQARKSVEAMAVALGRFKYHVGAYPTKEEGLDILVKRSVIKQGWNGPYVSIRNKDWDEPYQSTIVKDPWGEDYVYLAPSAERTEIALYSKGPDRQAGTADDIVATKEMFERPFKDTSWAKTWAPYHLRGIVVAPDEGAKARIEKEMQQYREAQKQ